MVFYHVSVHTSCHALSISLLLCYSHFKCILCECCVCVSDISTQRPPCSIWELNNLKHYQHLNIKTKNFVKSSFSVADINNWVHSGWASLDPQSDSLDQQVWIVAGQINRRLLERLLENKRTKAFLKSISPTTFHVWVFSPDALIGWSCESLSQNRQKYPEVIWTAVSSYKLITQKIHQNNIFWKFDYSSSGLWNILLTQIIDSS